MQTVAIVGVGLIGASFARALRQRVGFKGRILGVSRPEYVAAAVANGTVDEAVSLVEAAARADLIYLSSSISKILDTLTELGPILRPETLVTDAGSTKQAIVTLAGKTISTGVFVGGHPMAGKEARGSEAASADLFEGRSYFLSYVSPRDAAHPSVVVFREWLDRIGARVQIIEPSVHDGLVALTSHLPQLASTALAAALDAQIGSETARNGAGSGLVDMTRLAMSGYEGLWSDILATNRTAIDAALEIYIGELIEIRRTLANSQSSRFQRAGSFAKKLRS